MRSKIVYSRPIRYYVDDKEVSEEEFGRLTPKHDFADMLGCDIKTQNFSRPIALDSLAVHPEQVVEQMESDRKHGLAIEYTSDGRPLIHSEQQKRAYMKSRSAQAGLVDNHGNTAQYHDRDSFV